MEPGDKLTLRAFLIALSQLDSLGDVQAEINKLATLVKQDFSEAMKELRKIILQHNFLEEKYRLARNELQGKYQERPRDKCILPQNESEKLPELETKEIPNNSLPIDTVEVFVKILESNDSAEMAKNVQKSIENSPSEIPLAEATVTEPQYDPYAWVQMFC